MGSASKLRSWIAIGTGRNRCPLIAPQHSRVATRFGQQCAPLVERNPPRELPSKIRKQIVGANLGQPRGAVGCGGWQLPLQLLHQRSQQHLGSGL